MQSNEQKCVATKTSKLHKKKKHVSWKEDNYGDDENCFIVDSLFKPDHTETPARDDDDGLTALTNFLEKSKHHENPTFFQGPELIKIPDIAIDLDFTNANEDSKIPHDNDHQKVSEAFINYELGKSMPIYLQIPKIHNIDNHELEFEDDEANAKTPVIASASESFTSTTSLTCHTTSLCTAYPLRHDSQAFFHCPLCPPCSDERTILFSTDNFSNPMLKAWISFIVMVVIFMFAAAIYVLYYPRQV